jgi:hypothetical protein
MHDSILMMQSIILVDEIGKPKSLGNVKHFEEYHNVLIC